MWVLYHYMYADVSYKWPLLMNWTPLISQFCWSFYIVIQLVWYCGQYCSVLPLTSSLWTWSRFNGSTRIGWWNLNYRLTWLAWWNLIVVKQINGTITQLINLTNYERSDFNLRVSSPNELKQNKFKLVNNWE